MITLYAFDFLKILSATYGCLRKVRRIYNLYISSCIRDRSPNRVSSESLFNAILLSGDPPHGSIKGTNPALKKPSNIPEIYAKMFGRIH